MRKLTQALIRLYPAAWRERYESEFGALLEDVELNWRNALDILKGALGMQLRLLFTRRPLALTAVTGVVGLLIGLAAAMSMPKQYASISLTRLPQQNRDSLNAIGERLKAELNRTTLVELIRKYDLYPDKRSTMPSENAVNEMKEAIKITPLVGKSIFAMQIEFVYSQPEVAQKVVQDLTRRFGGEPLDPASLPTTPISPKPQALAILGLSLGLCAGGLLLILSRILKPA